MVLMKRLYYLLRYTPPPPHSPPLIFEKKKKIDPFERPTLQLMSVDVRSEEKDKLNSLPYNSKTLKGKS